MFFSPNNIIIFFFERFLLYSILFISFSQIHFFFSLHKVFKSDHLINGGGHCLHVFLSILFNVMITHGYNARDLRISSILFIPKDMKSSLTASDNYRGISLFNSICKVFDYTILDLCNDYFMTSDMQFGFENKHSTIMCSLA